MNSRPGMVEVIGIGWRYTSDRTIDDTAPVVQMMKIQLEIWAASRPHWPVAAIWTGSMPTAYQMNVARPAEAAATLRSRRKAHRLDAAATPRATRHRPRRPTTQPPPS